MNVASVATSSSRVVRRCLDIVFDKRRGPWHYAFTTATIIWLVTVAFSITASALFGYTEEPDPADSLLGIIALALIVAPLIENLLIVLIIECLRARRSRFWTVIAVGMCGLLAVATHSEYNLSHGIAAAMMFGVMAFTYIDWKELAFHHRYALTVAQHALCNLFTLLAFLYLE